MAGDLQILVVAVGAEPLVALFLIFPALLRSGLGFWVAFAIAVAITAGLYLAFFWAAPRIGLKL